MSTPTTPPEDFAAAYVCLRLAMRGRVLQNATSLWPDMIRSHVAAAPSASLVTPRDTIAPRWQRSARLGDRRYGRLKNLIAYVETDRCAADAVSVVTGCILRRRRLKWMKISPEDLPGTPSRKAICARCGELIRDGREVHGEEVLCRACATQAYCRTLAPALKGQVP